MTDTPRLWDRRADETPKSYAAFRAYVALGARYLTANDGADFLRAARALSLHFPPIQRVADVSERIEDLSDIPDADIERMKEIRDAARAKNEQTNLEE